MKFEKVKAPDHPPRTLESFRVREQHELSDESARYTADYNRIRAEHEARVQEIKDRYWRDSQAWLAAQREVA